MKIKNTNEEEMVLNEKLMRIIKKMPNLYSRPGNSFRRNKLALFVILSQMNEFKEFISEDYNIESLGK